MELHLFNIGFKKGLSNIYVFSCREYFPSENFFMNHFKDDNRPENRNFRQE